MDGRRTMAISYKNGVLAITGSDEPVIEPDAICEGCGARGTVGRAGRGDASSGTTEEHRFCIDFWPEWSASTALGGRSRRGERAWRGTSAHGMDTKLLRRRLLGLGLSRRRGTV